MVNCLRSQRLHTAFHHARVKPHSYRCTCTMLRQSHSVAQSAIISCDDDVQGVLASRGVRVDKVGAGSAQNGSYQSGNIIEAVACSKIAAMHMMLAGARCRSWAFRRA